MFRRIPFQVPDFDSLKLPQVLKRLIRRPNGLILVTGPTGSGKSTSLAALLDLLNRDPLLAPVRGIFAAQEIKPQARVLAQDRGIDCLVLDYDALRGTDDSASRLF